MCMYYFHRPQSVTEKLTCTSVIGYNPHKEKIMGIEVIGHFIAPFLQFSTKEVKFFSKQVSVYTCTYMKYNHCILL